MFFLLRMAFWLTVVLALLPAGSSSQPATSAPQIDAADAMVAAGAAVVDVTNFCDRQPGACKVGAQAAVAIGQRAQAGASMVYDFINERMTREQSARSETGSVPNARRASASAARPVPVLAGSQSTLTSADLEPVWQGSRPRRENVPLPRPRIRHPA